MNANSTPVAQRQDDTQARLPRVTVDFKIPLPWLLGGGGFLIWGLVNMWFQLRNVTEALSAMQVDVKATNATTIQFAQEQALIKYRVEKLEAERRQAAPAMAERR